MSAFLTLIGQYSDRYALSRADRAKLLAHYPMFKLASLAADHPDHIGRGARGAVRLARRHTVQHFITVDGRRVPVATPMDPSGFASFAEIFLLDEYDLGALDRVDTFVDLGANVGLTSLYVAAHFPVRRMLVVEANPHLVPGIRRMLAGVPATITVQNAAVLGHTRPEGIAFSIAANHRLSRVGVAGDTLATVDGYSLGDLLDLHGIAEGDLLKMDIEGSEFEVLEHDAAALRRFRYLFVEVHGEHRAQFVTDLTSTGFDVLVRTVTDDALVAFASRR